MRNEIPTALSILLVSIVVLTGCKKKEPEPTPETEAELTLPAESNPEAVKAAVEAAKAWLSLIDSGNYAESWEESAEFFRNAVTKEQWEKSTQAFRVPLGKLLSRELKSTHYTTTAPGAPDGQYVIIQYNSSFENKASAVETVTPMMDSDGQWRVSGYYIK